MTAKSGMATDDDGARGAAEGVSGMTDRTHKFKVGQTVDLIQSISRSAASGHYEILSLRPPEGGSPQYKIKSRSESHERVAAESDLILSTHRNFDD
jgi:hypothetical protein